MLPQTLKFLIGFATGGPIKPLISINEYFDLTLLVLLGLGLIFETPVLIFILSLFGIVTPKFLLKNFRYALVIITIVAAVCDAVARRYHDADFHGADDPALLYWCVGVVPGAAAQEGRGEGGNWRRRSLA